MGKETTGDRIKKERSLLGMSQAEVARLANVSVMTISCLERGETNDPSAKNIKPIAMAIKVNHNWLISGEGDKHQKSPAQSRIAQAMKDQGMTAFDLFEACAGKLAIETIDLWLCGSLEPSDAQFEIIAAPLHRSIDWLKSGLTVVQEHSSDRLVYDARGECEYPPDVQAMIDKYLALSQDGKDAAQSNIDVLAKLEHKLNEAK